MICLAMDFTGPAGQVAIAQNDKILHTDARPAGPGTVEGIVPFLLAAIEAAGIEPGAIDLFVATTGPGSFTGIRAGLAAAGGLALAVDRPLRGISVFDAVAAAVPAGDIPLLIALDGRRKELFVQLRGPDKTARGEPGNLAPDSLHTWAPKGALRLAGSAGQAALDGLLAAGRRADDLTLEPGALRVDIAAAARLGTAGPDHALLGEAAPFYGREPDVSRP